VIELPVAVGIAVASFPRTGQREAKSHVEPTTNVDGFPYLAQHCCAEGCQESLVSARTPEFEILATSRCLSVVRYVAHFAARTAPHYGCNGVDYDAETDPYVEIC
jgi:hypothetical protein